MFSSRQIVSSEKNKILLQKAKFFIFILNNLTPEERFTGSDLFKAFLPASKSVSSYYNSQSSFNEKTWGEDGLQAAMSTIKEIEQKTYWGRNLTGVYFYLCMSRAQYEEKKSGKGSNGYGDWRSDCPDISTLTTGIHQKQASNGNYLGDQYHYLKQLLSINFLKEGRKTQRSFMENNVSQTCDGASWEYSGQLKKINTEMIGYCKYVESPEVYEICFAKISIMRPGDPDEFILIDHPTLREKQGFDFLKVHEEDFNLALIDEVTYLTHTGRIIKTLATGALTKRGSASIVERLYRTIQLHHLKDWLPKYRLPINLDLLAIFTPHIEWFEAIFPALFFNKHALTLIEQTVQELKPIAEARQILIELEDLKNRFQEPNNKISTIARPSC